MPIQAQNTGYQSIPDQEEDVTPVDGSIAKRAKQSVKYVVIALIVVSAIAILIYVGFEFGPKPVRQTAIYQTSMNDDIGMRKLTAQELSDFTNSKLKSLTFSSKECDNLHNCNDASSAVGKIVVDPKHKHQTVVGFGGAFTEATALNFYKLPQKIQDSVIQLFFGQHGIGLTLGRVSINSCDFSTKSYSFDDIEGDYDLTYFDNEMTHDNAYILPLIRLAMAASSLPIKLLATPWSPPAWMKQPVNGNTSMIGSAVPDGLLDDSKTKLTWARYIARFISSYANKGVRIWAITPQNEPEFAAPWEACAYTAASEKEFIERYLGPVLHSEHPNVKLLGFDHNKDHLESWTRSLMSGYSANFVDGMAFHWYSGSSRVADGTYGYDAVNASHHFAPNALLLATEGCSCPGVDIGNWLRAERLGHDVMFDLLNHAQGWIDWNLIVDHEGGPNHLHNYCDASLVLNEDASDVIIQPKFHYLGHFSKFVTPGSVRLSSTAVGDYGYMRNMDPNVQAGLELGMYYCEKSVRQMWSVVSTQPSKPSAGGLLQLTVETFTQDDINTGDHSNKKAIKLCVSQGDKDRPVLHLSDCDDSGENSKKLHLHVVLNEQGQLLDKVTGMCVGLRGDVREPGALLELAPCFNSVSSNNNNNNFNRLNINKPAKQPHVNQDNHYQVFSVNVTTGEIAMPLIDPALCLTAGWPFLTAVAFQQAAVPAVSESSTTTTDSNGLPPETVVVVMNEASVPTALTIYDRSTKEYLSFAMEGRSIQTIVY